MLLQPVHVYWSESPSSSISHTKTFMSAHFPAQTEERWTLWMRKSSLSGLPAAFIPVRVHYFYFMILISYWENRTFITFHHTRANWKLDFIKMQHICFLYQVSSFMGLASLFVSILLMSSFVSRRSPSSSPLFNFVIVFLIWLGDEGSEENLFPPRHAPQHSSVIFCSFHYFLTIFPHFYILLGLFPFLPIIYPQLLLKMQQEVNFIFQTLAAGCLHCAEGWWAESAFLKLIGQNETSLIRSSSLFDKVYQRLMMKWKTLKK